MKNILGIRLPDKELRELKEIAEKDERTVSALVRLWIKQMIKKNKGKK